VREPSDADVTKAAQKPENKLVSAIAALVPAEIIGGHALALTAFTKTDDSGTTTITNSTALGASLVVLFVVGVLAFLIARGLANFERADIARALIPSFAFVAWTGLIGTSALTPWLTGIHAPAGSPLLLAIVLAIVLLAVNSRVNPPKPA